MLHLQTGISISCETAYVAMALIGYFLCLEWMSWTINHSGKVGDVTSKMHFFLQLTALNCQDLSTFHDGLIYGARNCYYYNTNWIQTTGPCYAQFISNSSWKFTSFSKAFPLRLINLAICTTHVLCSKYIY